MPAPNISYKTIALRLLLMLALPVSNVIKAQSPVQAPTYHLQLVHQNGITNPGDIFDLLRDKKGFLWILSRYKVQRFDGRNFITFSFDERCTNIREDSRGNIWLGTRQSLYLYKNDWAGFEKIPPVFADSIEYLQMHAGPGNKIYLLTKNKIVAWNTVKREMEILPLDIEAADNFHFLKTSGNFLFFQKNLHSLCRYNTVTRSADEVPVTDGNYLFLLNEDSAWVRQGIGGSALVSFSSKTVTPLSDADFNEYLSNKRYFITGSNHNGSFICLNDIGYFTRNKADNRLTRLNVFYKGLPLAGSPPVRAFYEEENGNIWFPNEEGLMHFNPAHPAIGLIRSNNAGNDKWNNAVRNITEDDEGNLWFATANGFCRMDKNSGAVKTWEPRFTSGTYLNYPSVKSIGYSNGKIIVGQSEKGFWIFDPVTNSFKRPNYENDSTRKIFEGSFNSNMLKLRNGNFLILSRRLWLLEKNGFTIKGITLPGPDPSARAALEDEKGRIWILGRNGIVTLDQHFNVLYSLADREKGRWYNSIIQVSDTSFWVAAKNLYELKLKKGGVLELSPLFPGLSDVYFSHLYKDQLNNTWMFSDMGIYRYLPKENIVEKFDISDNAQSYDISVSNSFRSSDGKLYAGSANGINYFNPEDIPLQNQPLQVHLMKVTVNRDDSSFLLGNSLKRLKHFQNNLVFDFIAPWFRNAEKIQYRYKMEGSTSDWVMTGNVTTVHFNSLPPGNYAFTAAASLNGKDWYQTPEPYRFTIAPPFWQTWWFRILLALLLIGLMAVFLKQRISKIKARASIQQQITELEVKALRAQMNPHFIFNAMNSIQQFTLKNETDNANRYISKFSTLLRKVLHSSQQNFITLEEEMEQLDLYLDIEKLRLGNDFEYTITTGDDTEPDAVKIPGMLIQPLVENAVKHGLGTKQGRKVLEIDFRLVTDNLLLVTITDNGIGREKATALRQSQQKLLPYESKGMKLVEERLQLVSKEKAGTGIQIEDVLDTEGRVAGTKVSLHIPLHQVG